MRRVFLLVGLTVLAFLAVSSAEPETAEMGTFESIVAGAQEFRNMGKRASDTNSYLACTTHADCTSGYCSGFFLCTNTNIPSVFNGVISAVFPFVMVVCIMLPILFAFIFGTCCFEGMGKCGADWDHSQ